MGLTSATVKIISAWFAFFLPSYYTYKALKGRPLSEGEIERLAQYWAVLGAFVSIEYILEWFISWFPFYFEFKILFLLFLSLPQIQGSTFIYKSYLQPFYTKNEVDIDRSIEAAKGNTFAWIQSHITSLINLVFSLINKNAQNNSGQQAAGAGAGAGGALNLQAAMGLWKAYAPALAGGANANAAGQTRTVDESMASAPSTAPTTSGATTAYSATPPPLQQRSSFASSTHSPPPATY